jgi:DNA-binding transcriptional MocR family regulator
VENDIYADLDPEPRPSLASLDQLNRVIYISSFSKTISPNIRVGYLAANPDQLEDLAQLKMISGTDLQRIQRAPCPRRLIDGRWRKHVKGLRERLAKAHSRNRLKTPQTWL